MLARRHIANGRFDQGIKQALLSAAGTSGGSTPPPAGTHQLHPNGNTSKCLDVQGGVFANGTPVQVCDPSSLFLTRPNFC